MSGVAAALVRFTMEMRNPWWSRVEQALLWQRMEPIDREKLIEQIQVHGGTDWRALFDDLDRDDIEDIITQYVVMWAGLAAFPLLNVDRKKSPEALAELFTLVIGMSRYKRERYTADDWKQVQTLAREAALEIDMEFVRISPDWGTP